jgi:hypothetical protein
VTGLSSKLTAVNLVKPCSASRSASSAMLLLVNTSVFRLGTLFHRLGWILEIRFRAHSSVCSRGRRGKLARVVMSLSVKSMAS